MDNDKILLAGDQRLSRSIIWQMQRTFFEEKGVVAWQEGIVPHHISSSSYMGYAYSRVVLGYLRDCIDAVADRFPIAAEKPIYIVELGSGNGRLAYHFLQHFIGRYSESRLAKIGIKFVMTDFVPEIVQFWQEHEHFKRFVDAGILDFALFDAENPAPLQLLHSGIILDEVEVENPVVLIANYFFDSIPQDAFLIEGGQLCENLLSVYSSEPNVLFNDEQLWEKIELQYEGIPTEQRYYENQLFNQILMRYEERLQNSSFLFPNVGLELIEFWRKLSNGRLLLLTSDRGYTAEEEFQNGGDPLPNLHGSFSMMVNYDAIHQYVAAVDGLILEPPHYQNNLQTVAYLLGQLPADGFETKDAFFDAVVKHSPDDFFVFKQLVDHSCEQLDLAQLLSCLRLFHWDGDIFWRCCDRILDLLEEVDSAWYADIRYTVRNVWHYYLPIGGAKDIPFVMGEILFKMGDYEDALFYFQESIYWFGDNPETAVYIEKCR